MSGADPLGLFQGFGIEIEYMIVDRKGLAVLPVADKLLAAEAGGPASDVERGPLCWSNELALHVIELKTNGPVADLHGVHEAFQADVRRINQHLEPLGGRLLPGGMHPLMDPAAETRLWPHEAGEIYAAFDRVFGCQGHGWSNLQSVHLNLPFAGDEEFGRLHAAVRVLLPILPALAAASPLMDGRLTGLMDTRLEVYRGNCRRIPQATGQVIPEPAFTRAAYEEAILAPLYQAMAPHDPEGILQHEWLNARGAIARFDRDAIEIRVLDTQEAPVADLAICTALVAVLRALVDERVALLVEQKEWPVESLARIFLDTVRRGDHAVIDDEAYLELLGVPEVKISAGELWLDLLERFPPAPVPGAEITGALRHLMEQGPLARRMSRFLGKEPGRDRIEALCRELAACLEEGRLLDAPA